MSWGSVGPDKGRLLGAWLYGVAWLFYLVLLGESASVDVWGVPCLGIVTATCCMKVWEGVAPCCAGACAVAGQVLQPLIQYGEKWTYTREAGFPWVAGSVRIGRPLMDMHPYCGIWIDVQRWALLGNVLCWAAIGVLVEAVRKRGMKSWATTGRDARFHCCGRSTWCIASLVGAIMWLYILGAGHVTIG